ncbi:RGD1559859 (predicted) [Rattus norvegicus]|uniref:RGD1559859 (Predicted) n=1 Tax=Rattus norvegicus TaxID=10116 RepID=A6IPI3_RAT|nr:RGD1559859 (predicted) [Rattus norvegicus]
MENTPDTTNLDCETGSHHMPSSHPSPLKKKREMYDNQLEEDRESSIKA